MEIKYAKFVKDTCKNISKEMNLIHVGLGLTGEAGEAADAIKKHVIYGKELDTTNLLEELGDILWYVQAGLNTVFQDSEGPVTLAYLMEMNMEKLMKRYPQQYYSDADALSRKDKNSGDKTLSNIVTLVVPKDK